MRGGGVVVLLVLGSDGKDGEVQSDVDARGEAPCNEPVAYDDDDYVPSKAKTLCLETSTVNSH